MTQEVEKLQAELAEVKKELAQVSASIEDLSGSSDKVLKSLTSVLFYRVVQTRALLAILGFVVFLGLSER